MKKIKSIAAVLACFCIIAAMFAGCSKISLEGTWKATCDLTDAITSELNQADDAEMGKYAGEFAEPISIDVIYTFDKNNAYTVSVDEEKFRADLEAYMEKYIDYILEATYKYAEEQGMSREDMDKYYEQEMGETVREGIAKELTSDDMVTEVINGFKNDEPQQTLIKDGKFYETDDNGNKKGYETYTLENDVLTINGQFDMNDQPIEDEDGIYPIVLTKQA